MMRNFLIFIHQERQLRLCRAIGVRYRTELVKKQM